MKNVKNLKVLGASLCLGAVLLTGCGKDKIEVGKSVIVIEEEKTIGNISYEDIEQQMRIVSLNQDGKVSYHLLVKESDLYYGGRSDYAFYSYSYYDLKTGVCLIKYRDYYNQEKIEYTIGEELNIVEESKITPYLVSNAFIQKEYTVEEILNFFNEQVLPTLENNSKELIR